MLPVTNISYTARKVTQVKNIKLFRREERRIVLIIILWISFISNSVVNYKAETNLILWKIISHVYACLMILILTVLNIADLRERYLNSTSITFSDWRSIYLEHNLHTKQNSKNFDLCNSCKCAIYYFFILQRNFSLNCRNHYKFYWN